jgi:TrpR-related protein YerC/YecD
MLQKLAKKTLLYDTIVLKYYTELEFVSAAPNTRKEYAPMKDDTRDSRLEFLFKGILTLDSVEDCYQFFRDLCTPFELQEMAQRMQAAKMLKEGLIYSEIAERTGLSTATISRVNRSLRYSDDGYAKVLDALELQEKRQWRNRH